MSSFDVLGLDDLLLFFASFHRSCLGRGQHSLYSYAVAAHVVMHSSFLGGSQSFPRNLLLFHLAEVVPMRSNVSIVAEEGADFFESSAFGFLVENQLRCIQRDVF